MIVATRVLHLSHGKSIVDVPVHIFAPEQVASKAWKCEFEILFPGDTKRRAATGVDSAQALIQCLWIVGIVLYTSEHHDDGSLYWEKPGDGYGFPVIGPHRDILAGSDAKYF